MNTLNDKVVTFAKHLLCSDCSESDTCDMDVELRCPNDYAELLAAAEVGEEHAKEKAARAFCNIIMHESLDCAMERTFNMSCRSKCLMYKEFINETSN